MPGLLVLGTPLSGTWVPLLLLLYLTVFAAVGILFGISLLLKQRRPHRASAPAAPHSKHT